MAEAFVQLPPDSTGKKIRSFENTIGGNVVESQALTLVDASGNIIASLATAPAGGEQAVAVRPIESDVTAAGTITATDLVVGAPDGSGQLLSGASTAGSLVSLALPGGDASVVAQITGLTSGSLYFEGSVDSTTGTDGHWTALQCQRVGIPGRAAFVATANGIFRGDASALSYVRVRAAGALSGTPAVSLRVSDATPAVLVDGARTALVGPLGDEVDTIAGALATRLADVDAVQGDPGQRARLVAGGHKEIPYVIGASQQMLTLDVRNYAFVSIQATVAGVTVNVEHSNDGTNWSAAYLSVESATPGATLTNLLSGFGSIYAGPLRARYLRLRGTAGAAASGIIELFSHPKTASTLTVNGTAGTLGVTASLGQGLTDGTNNATNAVVPALGYNGTTWDRMRTPAIFKTATATASGNTALWTPTAGKKFRLMGYVIYVPANAAISGGAANVEVTFQDSTTDMGVGYSQFVPTLAGTTFAPSGTSGPVQLGNGKLSAAANNVLSINLSATLTTGEVRATVWGTEE